MNEKALGDTFPQFIRNLDEMGFEEMADEDDLCAARVRPIDAALADRIEIFARAKREIGRYVRSRVER